jgi:hypothetical protein
LTAWFFNSNRWRPTHPIGRPYERQLSAAADARRFIDECRQSVWSSWSVDGVEALVSKATPNATDTARGIPPLTTEIAP